MISRQLFSGEGIHPADEQFPSYHRQYQYIARQRRQWYFETAKELIDKAEVIFVEDLNVSNMSRRNQAKQWEDSQLLPNGQLAKSGLNKSFVTAGIAGFLNFILPKVVKVNLAGTSQPLT